ncbi:MAG TPA: creatininase family protein [bacterium]|nr:creatininase family protein [bacterium]
MPPGGQRHTDGPGVYLDRLTWPEAAAIFHRDPLIVLPVGAAAKEHGPHLPLGTDRILAEHLAGRIAERVSSIIAPTVAYGYYPAFAEFPGSTHLEAETFGAVVREIIVSLHRHGPRRFLILNTGISTYPVLEIAARDLRRRHPVLIGVTRIEDLGGRALEGLLEQRAGGHADEYETSVLLALAPDVVRRDRLVREIPDRARPRGLFVPAPLAAPGAGDRETTGVYGDATLASPEKGVRILATIVPAVITAAEHLRTAPIE